MHKAFTAYQRSNGLLADLDPRFPSTLRAWDHDHRLELPAGATHFLYLHVGIARLNCDAGDFTLGVGLYASVPGACAIRHGAGFAVSREGYHGMFSLGGPVEQRGRLRYIDGCTDSLLIPPVMKGDPCLNLLQFPPGTDQTAHTHPSDRIGMVISGRGECVHSEPEEVTPLVPGLIFCIHTDGRHKFRTRDSEMRVIAYHPDSDFGPTHEEHPMLNRTFVEGVSARDRPDLHTAAERSVAA